MSDLKKNPERAFIHDLSNQLTVAIGMVEVVQSELSGFEGLNPKVVERLEKAVRAMTRMSEMMRLRREEIIHKEAEQRSS